MNNKYSGKNEVPRWLTQGRSQVGSAGADQIKAVSPQDLEVASQMYGQVSDRAFRLAENAAQQLNFIRPDYDAMKSNEAVLQGVEAIEMMRADPEASKDGPTFRQKSASIMDDVTKAMGPLEARLTKKILNDKIIDHSLDITQHQTNMAAAEVVKFNQKSWDAKSKSFLSQVDSSWSSDEMAMYSERVKQTRRADLPHLGEPHHAILDKELDLDLAQAAVVNELFRTTPSGLEVYRVPGQLSKVVSSDKFQSLLNDPVKYGRAKEVLENLFQVHNTNLEFTQAMREQEVAANYTSFISEYESTPDPVRKRQIYQLEKKRAGNFGVSYQQKIKAFGASMYNEGVSVGNSSVQSTDKFFQAGAEGKYTAAQVSGFAASGAWTKSQVNAYNSGTKVSASANSETTKSFDAKIQAIYKVNVSSKSGPNADILRASYTPAQKKVYNDIKAAKAALAGLPPEEYAKELDKLYNRFDNKATQEGQKKPMGSKSSKSDNLRSRYAAE